MSINWGKHDLLLCETYETETSDSYSVWQIVIDTDKTLGIVCLFSEERLYWVEDKETIILKKFGKSPHSFRLIDRNSFVVYFFRNGNPSIFSKLSIAK